MGGSSVAAPKKAPAELWQYCLEGFPESFRSMANIELEVGGSIFPVHQHLLCLHSKVFSQLCSSCAPQASPTRTTVPLSDDRPQEAYSYLLLLYQRVQAKPNITQKVSAQVAAGAACFAHKYAASKQLELCDALLHEKIGFKCKASHEVAAWGPLQWISFAEQHHLPKTLAGWECWTINHFSDIEQDILNDKDAISSSSLTRICRGLHKLCARAQQRQAACDNAMCPTARYTERVCRNCNTCKYCQSPVWDGASGCQCHHDPGAAATSAGAIDEATLMSWLDGGSAPAAR